jgi:hypothetical protein
MACSRHHRSDVLYCIFVLCIVCAIKFHKLVLNPPLCVCVSCQVLLSADTNDDASIDFEEFLQGVSHMDTGTVKKDTWKLEARLKKCEQVAKLNHNNITNQIDEMEIEARDSMKRLENTYYVWLEKVGTPLVQRLENARKM